MFCLDYPQGMWMMMDMGEYTTHSRADYTKFPNKVSRGKDQTGLNAVTGCHIESEAYLTHLVLCDDVRRISPTPFAGLCMNQPVKIPRMHRTHKPADEAPRERPASRLPDTVYEDIRTDPMGIVPLTISIPKNGQGRSVVSRP